MIYNGCRYYFRIILKPDCHPAPSYLLRYKPYYAFLIRLLIVMAITKKTDAPINANFFELSFIPLKLNTFTVTLVA